MYVEEKEMAMSMPKALDVYGSVRYRNRLIWWERNKTCRFSAIYKALQIRTNAENDMIYLILNTKI